MSRPTGFSDLDVSDDVSAREARKTELVKYINVIDDEYRKFIAARNKNVLEQKAKRDRILAQKQDMIAKLEKERRESDHAVIDAISSLGLSGTVDLSTKFNEITESGSVFSKEKQSQWIAFVDSLEVGAEKKVELKNVFATCYQNHNFAIDFSRSKNAKALEIEKIKKEIEDVESKYQAFERKIKEKGTQVSSEYNKRRGDAIKEISEIKGFGSSTMSATATQGLKSLGEGRARTGSLTSLDGRPKGLKPKQKKVHFEGDNPEGRKQPSTVLASDQAHGDDSDKRRQDDLSRDFAGLIGRPTGREQESMRDYKIQRTEKWVESQAGRKPSTVLGGSESVLGNNRSQRGRTVSQLSSGKEAKAGFGDNPPLFNISSQRGSSGRE